MASPVFDVSSITGVSDWIVDVARRLFGLPPRPPVILCWGFEETPTLQVETRLHLRSRRAVHAHLRATQDQKTLFEGAVPPNGVVSLTPLTPDPINLHLSLESSHSGAGRHGQIIAETLVPVANTPSPTRIDLMSTAFWDAFWAGLACPTQLYASRHDENYKLVGRVDTAWKKVGGYIYASIDSMGDNIDNRKSNKRAK